MRIISSVQNENIKYYEKLKEKSFRKKEQHENPKQSPRLHYRGAGDRHRGHRDSGDGAGACIWRCDRKSKGCSK